MNENESSPARGETTPGLDTHNTTPPEIRRSARRLPQRPPEANSRRRVKRAGARRRGTYGAILALLGEGGAMTDDELYRRYVEAGYRPSSRQNIGTVRRELADAGKVRYTGHRGSSDMGNSAKLWERVADDPEAELLATAAASALAREQG